MPEARDWIEPQITTTGCCEGARWQLRLPGPVADRSQFRLAGLAVNPAAPADVLLGVARGGGRLPRLVLAERFERDLSEEFPDVVAALVAVATDSGDPHLVTRLALGGGFSSEAVAAFAASPDHRVRESVPWMAACPAETLAALADDPHPEVRRAVAFLSDLDLSLMIKLAQDPDPQVRDAVGDRVTDLPAEIVEILAQDPARPKRRRARRAPQRLYSPRPAGLGHAGAACPDQRPGAGQLTRCRGDQPNRRTDGQTDRRTDGQTDRRTDNRANK